MVVALSLTLAGIPLTTNATTEPGAAAQDIAANGDQAGRYVIYFEPDGFDPRYIERYDTPNIDALARRGSYSVGEGVFKATSQVSRVSIVTGAYPEVTNHQAYYYDFVRQRAVRDESPSAPEVPVGAETIGQVIADTDGVNLAAIAYPQLLNHGASYEDLEHLYVGAPASCAENNPRAIDAAIDILHERPVDRVGGPGGFVTVPRIPDLLFVRCVDPDSLGHSQGPNGPDIPAMVANIDHQVGRLVQATKDVGIYGRTTFFFGADHGIGAISEPLLPDVLDYLDATGFSWEVVPWGQPVSSPGIEIVMNATSRSLSIHLRGDAATTEGKARIAEALANVGDRAIVHDTDDLARMHAGDRVGDFAISPLEPYHLSSNVTRPPGGGHSGAQEMRTPLVISGHGIRPRVQPVEPKTVDLAPTMAALLRIRQPAEAQGRVLDEILLPSRRTTSD